MEECVLHTQLVISSICAPLEHQINSEPWLSEGDLIITILQEHMTLFFPFYVKYLF